MLLVTCLRVPLNCVVLFWVKFYDVDAVHELSVSCAPGRPGINGVLDLFACFKLLKSTRVGILISATPR